MKKRFVSMIVTLLVIGLAVLAQAQWHFQPGESSYEFAPGENFTVEIMLSGSGVEVDAFGFDVYYPVDLIQYNSSDFTGTLLEGWNFKDANEYSPGALKVAGFTISGMITSPAAGVWVKLNFTVREGVNGEGEFTIGAFGDDLLTDGSTSAPASFKVKVTDDIETWHGNTPVSFQLFQNFPNPFNPQTSIQFRIPEMTRVTLKVYDILGHEIITLNDGLKPAGTYQIKWNGRNNCGEKVTSGVYIYKIQAGECVEVKKMVLLQ